MRQHNHGGPKLPRELLDRIRAPGASSNGRPRGAGAGRKDRRRAEREQKKSQRRQPRALHRPVSLNESASEGDEPGFSPPPPKARKPGAEQKPLKSILKRTETPAGPEPNKKPSEEKKLKKKEKRKEEASPSPPPPSRPMPRAVQEKLAEEDVEIAALEKKLGIKGKKKLPKSFEDDGLDELLEGLDDELDFAVTGKRKRSEDQEWLENKRRKASGGLTAEESFGDEDSDMDGWEDEEEDDESLESDAEDDVEAGLGVEVDGEEDDFAGFSGDEDGDEDLEESGESDLSEGEDPGEEEKRPKVRENPYLPPVAANSNPAAKYIPPSLRAPESSDAEAMTRLRRQTQGLLNRLSEANLVTILKDVEQLYRNNPRQYVTSTLIDLLLGSFCDRASLQDTFLILHAGFIAAIYKVIGTDFGAQIVERLVGEFDKCYSTHEEDVSNKQTTNLMSLMAEMYNFQVIGSNLVFDYIRLFLEELSEINTELLLRIIRMAGPQLRQDDPTALKDIVVLLQKSVAKTGEANLSVRTKFMIETINNLKNNRIKTGVAASAITSEHTTRMKKTLGSLNTRTIKASEPLRIGLKDVRDTEKKGKWWLVGASWRSDGTEEPAAGEKHAKDKKAQESAEEIIDSGTTNLLQLAKEQRMNTDIRRAIFITIMSASDFKDAQMRLLKLRLKKSQELEIPRVLIHCAGAEQSYNPYYTLIARRLCAEKQLKKAFQFSLWDLFKRMGEKDDGDDADFDEDGDEALTTRKIVNLAKMFGTLVADGGLSITVLKTLNFAYLQAKTEAFVEVLLSTAILRSQKSSADQRDEKAVLDVVMKAKDAAPMSRGLQYFFKKVVSKAGVGGSKVERDTVRWGAGVAADGLTVLATQRMEAE